MPRPRDTFVGRLAQSLRRSPQEFFAPDSGGSVPRRAQHFESMAETKLFVAYLRGESSHSRVS